jgi:amidase
VVEVTAAAVRVAAVRVAAMVAVHRWCRQVLSWWHPADGTAGFDLLLTPTIATPPPRIGYLSEPGHGERIFELLQYTSQFNLTGQPAISLPLGRTAANLPIGAQVCAAKGGEGLLLEIAYLMEMAMPWKGYKPGIFAA